MRYYIQIIKVFLCLLLIGAIDWLVGFSLKGPFRQYFSLYRAVTQNGGEKKEMIDERKNVQTAPHAPTGNAVGPCPTTIKISRTPRHWKFTQHHRTTRPPPINKDSDNMTNDIQRNLSYNKLLGIFC